MEDEPRLQHPAALETIKAHYAYGNGSAGFDGTGVTVAVIADGIDNYAALQDAAGMARPTRVASTGYGGSTRTAGAHVQDCEETTTTCGGTSTATVIAGLTLGSSVTEANSLRGVAPGAKLLDIPFEDIWDVVCTNNPALSSTARGDCTRRIFGGTIGMHADVLGALIGEAVARTDKPRYLLMYSTDPLAGGSSDSHQYLPLYTDAAPPPSLAVTFLQGMLSGVGQGIWQGGPPASGEDPRSIVVVAAGDDRDSNPLLTRSCRIPGIGDSPVSCGDNSADDPRLYGLLPVIADLVGGDSDPSGEQLAQTLLVAVGLDATPDSNGKYPLREQGRSDSNRCGRAAAWCIAAPSEGIKTHGNGGRVVTGGSTYYAAALVTGALALVDSAFNADAASVSPIAVRKRLLDTADKTGIYGTEAIYGQGVLDIQAALSPQGPMTTPAPPGSLGLGSVRDPGLPLAGLGLALPGHALAMLGDTRVMTLDSHGFPFYVQLRQLAHRPLAQASLFADMMASGVAQGPAAVVPIASGLLDISAGVGNGAAWGSALTPQHLVQGGQGGHAGHLAAGTHLAVSPLMASSLESDGTGHVAVRAHFGQQSIAAMACTQRHTQRDQESVQGNGDNACMAVGWDWNSGDSFGLSVRAHALDSRGGLYRYGARCFDGSCAGGGATATELGLGGFARLSQGLRLGWNWWHGWADDIDGGSDIVRYEGMGHSAGSIALESANGAWSLYVQQPLRAEGSLQLVLPERRDPAGNVHFARHHLRLDGAVRPVRLGLSSRLDLTRRGGFMALDLGAERGLHRHPGAHPYLALQTSIPW